MKLSIAISALILAVGAAVGWKIDARLAAARTEEELLVDQAAGFGLSILEGRSVRVTKRERKNSEENAKQLAIEFETMATLWESGIALDSVLQEKDREIRKQLAALEPSQLEHIIIQTLSSNELTESIRAARSLILLGLLAKNDPQGALALFAEHPELFKSILRAETLFSDCLGNWAKVDPAATVDWMMRNPGNLPDGMIRSARRAVVHSVAENDPRLAFQLASGFEMEPLTVLNTIVAAAGSNPARTKTLVALREYLDAHKGDPDVSQHAERSFGYFSWGFKPDGFDAAREWVASADLSPEELDGFCAGLSISGEVDEPNKWIEWMAEVLPAGEGDGNIMNLVARWTRDDYQAAGEWLGKAPEGPFKNAAICGYAQTVSNHDPDTAMRWIMTLPPGTDCDTTLKSIYQNWPKEDAASKAAAEEFAQRHGIPR